MKKKMIHIKEFLKHLKRINPSVLASSLAFYIIIVIFPLTSLISQGLILLGLINSESYSFNIAFTSISGILLFINLIWVSSKLIDNLINVSDLIYIDIENRTGVINRIKAFFQMLLILLIIITVIVLVLFFIYIFNQIVPARYHFLVSWLEFVLIFISITFINGYLYKFITPIKVKFKNTMIVSSIVTIIIYIINFVYKLIIKITTLKNFQNIYGSSYHLIFIMLWLYTITTVFIYGLIAIYYIDQTPDKNTQKQE